MVKTTRKYVDPTLMSRTFRITVVAAAAFMVVASGCSIFGAKNGMALAVLLFVLPVMWIMWALSAFFEFERAPWTLLLLWGLIDLDALVLLNQLVSNARSAQGPGGEDVAYFVAFSPLVWPALLVAPFVPVGIFGGIQALMATVTLFSSVVLDWFCFSVVAAIPSLLIAGIPAYLRKANQ